MKYLLVISFLFLAGCGTKTTLVKESETRQVDTLRVIDRSIGVQETIKAQVPTRILLDYLGLSTSAQKDTTSDSLSEFTDISDFIEITIDRQTTQREHQEEHTIEHYERKFEEETVRSGPLRGFLPKIGILALIILALVIGWRLLIR